jgi:hypothetical protein
MSAPTRDHHRRPPQLFQSSFDESCHDLHEAASVIVFALVKPKRLISACPFDRALGHRGTMAEALNTVVRFGDLRGFGHIRNVVGCIERLNAQVIGKTGQWHIRDNRELL